MFSTFTPYLLACLVLTAVLFLSSFLKGFEHLAKKFFVGYAWFIFLLLCLVIYLFIGFDKNRNYRLPLEAQRRIALLGYYVDPESEITFSGKANAREFAHVALAHDEYIKLKPNWNRSTSRSDTWNLKYNTHTSPLRINNKCINLPAEWWLSPGDELFIARTVGERTFFLSVKWTKKQGVLGSREYDAYLYSQGERSDGQLVYKQTADGRHIKELEFSFLPISEGTDLSTLLARSTKEFAALFKDEIVGGNELNDVLEQIQLIREEKGKYDSRLAILPSKSLLQQQSLEIFKNQQFKFADIDLQGERNDLRFSDTISYGLGYRNVLTLNLSDKVEEDKEFGNILEIKFKYPQSWSLIPNPTSDFIITSTKDYIPLEGYQINIGSEQEPVYAKAKLDSELSQVTINDGKPHNNQLDKTYKLDEVIHIGSREQGALLALQPLRPYPVYIDPHASAFRQKLQGANSLIWSYPGEFAIGFLVLITILFSLTLIRDKKVENRWRLDLAWTLIWGITQAILVTRLVLSYRINLLPPNDAGGGEIEVFRNSLYISFWALLLLPLGLIIFRHLEQIIQWIKNLIQWIKGLRIIGWKQKFIRRVRSFRLIQWITQHIQTFIQWVKSFRLVTWILNRDLLWLYWLLPIIWILVSKAFGRNEAFLMRINLMTHLLLILGVVITAKRIADASKKAKTVLLIIILITFALMLFGVRDRGFIIFSFSFSIYFILLFLWGSHKYSSRKLFGKPMQSGYLSPLLLIIILFSSYLMIQTSTGEEILQWIETADYRVASLNETEETLLLRRSNEAEVDIPKFLKSSQQHWQMMLYAATGSDSPQGFGQAPLSKKAMTYPTSMSDCVYSIYVLAEHGMWASWFLILLYTIIGFACFYASRFLQNPDKSRSLPLILIGSFFACNAIYMAFANLKVVIFTGQNIPLLSLHSSGDLFQSSFLLIFVTILLRYNLTKHETILDSRYNATRNAGVVFITIIGLVAFFLVISLYNVGSSREKYASSYTIPKETLNQIKDHAAKDKNSAWEFNEQECQQSQEQCRLNRKSHASISVIEEYYQSQFNKRTNKFDSDGGLYYLKKAADTSSNSKLLLEVNDEYFKMESPFEDKNPKQIWSGLILSRDDKNEATISAFGKPYQINVKDDGESRTVMIDAEQSRQVGNTALVGEGDKVYFDIKKRDGQFLITPKKDGNWRLFVDGAKIEKEEPLKEHAIIVFERDKKDGNGRLKTVRHNLFYLGEQPPVLAFVKWRNGQNQRIVTANHLAPLIYTMGKAADLALQKGQQVPGKISLTLEPTLQRGLHDDIEAFALREPYYRENDPLHTDPIAVTIMDAFSGEIRALVSWPFADPTDKKFAALQGEQQGRLLTNYNFTNHPVGSTVKPLVFSALSAQLWPQVDLSQLVVFNQHSDGQWHRRICNIPINGYDCQSGRSPINASDFLIHSQNYYEVTLGMLGMLSNSRDFDRILVPTNSQTAQPELQYRGRNSPCNLTNVDVPLTRDNIPKPTSDMDQTLLFRGLPQMYNVNVTSQTVNISKRDCETFLPSLCAEDSLLANNYYIDNVLPQPVVFDPDSYQDIKNSYFQFLIGAEEGRWNNVRMAESVARLITGKQINAKLEPNSVVENDLPAPLNNINWRRNHLIEPMKLAGEIGTAKWMRGLSPVNAPYRVIYKTGTISEGSKGRESEALLFVIGRWDDSQGEFIEGETLAGFLYLKEAQIEKGDSMRKFNCAAPIIKSLLTYLKNLQTVSPTRVTLN